MPDFSKGKIYKLVSNISSDVYIGSCIIELCRRLSKHKSPSNTCASKSMFINDAIITIVLIENYPCETKNQLKARELHYRTTIECIIKNRPFITDIIHNNYNEWKKEYDLMHKEYINEYKRQHYESNKHSVLERQKQYYETNKQVIKEKAKKTYLCDCGTTTYILHKTHHIKTTKHLQLINKLYLDELTYYIL